jgi:hypothetical protein
MSPHSGTLFWFRANRSLLFLLNAACLVVECSSIPNCFQICINHIGRVMVSVLASSMVDRGFEPRSDQIKDYNIGICSFSTKHAALRRKSKDRLARNQNNVPEWGDMSISRLYKTQCVRTKHTTDVVNADLKTVGYTRTFKCIYICIIYSTIFRAKRFNNRTRSVRLYNSQNRGIYDLYHEPMHYHI